MPVPGVADMESALSLAGSRVQILEKYSYGGQKWERNDNAQEEVLCLSPQQSLLDIQITLTPDCRYLEDNDIRGTLPEQLSKLTSLESL